MKRLQMVCALLVGLTLLIGCGAKQPAGPADAVVIKTTQGEMVVELHPNLSPNAVDSFRRLVTENAYNGVQLSTDEGRELLTTAKPSGSVAGIHALTATEINSRKHDYGTVSFVPGEENNGALSICLARKETFDAERIAIGQIIQGAGTLDKLRKGDTIQAIVPTHKQEHEKVAVMATSKGDLIIEFYPESALHAVENFRKLVSSKFYNGLTFHRYVEGFVVQGGDPSGDGTGGPGYHIPDEYRNAYQRPHVLGTVAMARTQEPNSAGSQFYFCLDRLRNLDGSYTTFGKIIEGIDVMKQLRQGDQIIRVTLKDRSKYVRVD